MSGTYGDKIREWHEKAEEMPDYFLKFILEYESQSMNLIKFKSFLSLIDSYYFSKQSFVLV
jgi:hypothetical protein